MTNYEKVKSMTIEDMAEFIANFDTDEYCKYCDEIFVHCNGRRCKDTIIDWLTQEVQNEKSIYWSAHER